MVSKLFALQSMVPTQLLSLALTCLARLGSAPQLIQCKLAVVQDGSLPIQRLLGS